MKNFVLPFFILILNNILISQSKNFIDQPYLETSAKIDTMITPDRIYLTIKISEKDTKGKQSVEELENRMAKALQSLGVKVAEELTLTDLSSNFKRYFLRNQDILKTKSYELLVYTAQKAGSVIQGLEKIGISNVNLERTEYSKMDVLMLDLREKAMSKAKRQAMSLVRPLGQSIGRAIFISDVQTQNENILMGKVSGIRQKYSDIAQQSFESIPIEFDKITVENEINVKFIIE